MEFPDDLLYTNEDEWIRVDGGEATVGITDFAQDQLSDIVYLQLPDVGSTFTRKEPFGEIESVKAISDLRAPVSGEVTATNDRLMDAPELVNASPYVDGWLIRIRLTDPAELDGLMGAAEYRGQLPEDEV